MIAGISVKGTRGLAGLRPEISAKDKAAALAKAAEEAQLEPEEAPDPTEEAREKRRTLFMDVFSKFDEDGSGSLEEAEFFALMGEVSKGYWTDAKITELLKAADANCDGKIDVDELARWSFSPVGGSVVRYAQDQKVLAKIPEGFEDDPQYVLKFTNLSRRMPDCNSDEIAAALDQAGGHAGEAFKILRGYMESRRRRRW